MELTPSGATPEVDVNERMRALLRKDRPTFDAFCESLGMDGSAAANSLLADIQETTEGLRD